VEQAPHLGSEHDADQRPAAREAAVDRPWLEQREADLGHRESSAVLGEQSTTAREAALRVGEAVTLELQRANRLRLEMAEHREIAATLRERALRLRERAADERERAADRREHLADERQATQDRQQSEFDQRAAEDQRD
jgi:hypothetical protein